MERQTLWIATHPIICSRIQNPYAARVLVQIPAVHTIQSVERKGPLKMSSAEQWAVLLLSPTPTCLSGACTLTCALTYAQSISGIT